jgi:hypothetical protein
VLRGDAAAAAAAAAGGDGAAAAAAGVWVKAPVATIINIVAVPFEVRIS